MGSEETITLEGTFRPRYPPLFRSISLDEHNWGLFLLLEYVAIEVSGDPPGDGACHVDWDLVITWQFQ